MKQKLLELLDRINLNKNILVIGDLILDEFVYGEVIRISREAPVPIVQKKAQKFVCGGGANAARNIASLGAKVYCVGLVGPDKEGDILKNLLSKENINVDGVFINDLENTILKTRISAYSPQSVTQQIVRLDCLPEGKVSSNLEAKIIDYISTIIPKIDAVLLSDYGYGIMTSDIIETCRNLCNKYSIPWIVDSQEDLKRFYNATLITPNQPEAENNLRKKINNDLDSVKKACIELKELTKVNAVLITRGGEGMSLYYNDSFFNIPPFNREEVFDVTGAGDTVAGTITLSIASGLTLEQSAYISSLAAGIVIKHFGTAVTTLKEMKETLTKE